MTCGFMLTKLACLNLNNALFNLRAKLLRTAKIKPMGTINRSDHDDLVAEFI